MKDENKWFDAKVETPQREGKIVVKISDRYFFGLARNTLGIFYFSYLEPSVDYTFTIINDISEVTGNIQKIMISGKWEKPSHFADVEYWCYLPELPK